MATDYDTLLIFAPPGSAKSHHVSVAFPPWYLANYHDRSVIAASHSAELAAKWGRRVRNLISGNSAVLGIELAQDSQAADRWALASGAEYLAAGVQAGIAGFRADLGIIDDPFGSKEDAYSERIRDRVWDWYINDFSARLKPGAKRVIMHTRWHLDDLAGRVIEHAAQTGQKVRVVTIPAIAGMDDPLGRKSGEYLWDEPEGYNYAAFLKRRQTETPPMEWAALYQQQPIPEGGGYFKAEWILYYDELPEHLRKYGASDYAVTADGGDFTEHGIGGIDSKGDLYLIDWWYGQTQTDVWIDVFLDMAGRHQPLAWGEESGQIIKSLGPFIERRMVERGVHCYRQQFVSVADKAVRAQSIRGRMSMGRVWLPRHAPWVKHVVAQLMTFPAGKHDDAVDVLSLFGRMLDQMEPAAAQRPDRKPRRPQSWMAA
ncbi:MAG: phage terminase large subunit [Proteobacteria bacterium]|nr:phage terminase large subunit [Pseudomonadota bacterium]